MRANHFKITVILLMLNLVSCAPTVTLYEPAKTPEHMGYIDKKIADKKYEIRLKGNAHTTFETLEIYFHRRAAELCGDTDYKSSVIDKVDVERISGGFRENYLYNNIATSPLFIGEVECK